MSLKLIWNSCSFWFLYTILMLPLYDSLRNKPLVFNQPFPFCTKNIYLLCSNVCPTWDWTGSSFMYQYFIRWLTYRLGWYEHQFNACLCTRYSVVYLWGSLFLHLFPFSILSLKSLITHTPSYLDVELNFTIPWAAFLIS